MRQDFLFAYGYEPAASRRSVLRNPPQVSIGIKSFKTYMVSISWQLFSGILLIELFMLYMTFETSDLLYYGATTSPCLYVSSEVRFK